MMNEFSKWRRSGAVGALGAAVALAMAAALPAAAQEPIRIGHVAALSGASAQSGEAITRGLAVAIDEINAKGGLLGGRKLELVQRDDELVPPKGVVAARELISKEKVVAMFGGIDTPVALACVPVVNKEKVPYMAVWAAGTGITRNGADPNFVFRVSAVDVLVDVKLLDYASKKFGSKKPGLMLINNPWGASNEQGLVAADKDNAAVEIAGIEKFENNDVDMTPQLTRLKEKGADSIILVVNTPPGAQMMKSRERMGWKVPVVSHWGISGGRFPELAGSDRRRCALRADLQLLRQAEPDRRARAGGAQEEVSGRSRGRRTSSLPSARPTPTTPCTSWPSRSRKPARPTATRSARRWRT